MEGFVKTRVFRSPPQSWCGIIKSYFFTHNNTSKCKQTESWDAIHHDHPHLRIRFCAVVNKFPNAFHMSGINTKGNESIKYNFLTRRQARSKLTKSSTCCSCCTWMSYGGLQTIPRRIRGTLPTHQTCPWPHVTFNRLKGSLKTSELKWTPR